MNHSRELGSFFPPEERSDVYLVTSEKGGKKLGIKARGKEDASRISAGDKGAWIR